MIRGKRRSCWSLSSEEEEEEVVEAEEEKSRRDSEVDEEGKQDEMETGGKQLRHACR